MKDLSQQVLYFFKFLLSQRLLIPEPLCPVLHRSSEKIISGSQLDLFVF